MAEIGFPFETTHEPAEPELDEAEVSATEVRSLPDGFAYGQIVRIDPARCDICALNGRATAMFDPIANKSLVDDIRTQGQLVPAILRGSITEGRFELVAGTRRLGAVQSIRAFDPEVLLLAELRDLTDQQAWSVAEAENSHRKDISDLERARNWEQALETLFGGNQSALARALNVDKSVVSRALTLATLPEIITVLVVRPETLRMHFAEKIAPALKDEERRTAILGHAANLADNGVKLAPAELLRRLLLTGAEAEAFRPVPIKAGRQERQAVWQHKENGSSHLTIKPVPPELSREERKALIKELSERIRAHVEGE